MHTVLTIAASDSGGACGVQADLKTIAACGLYGASAITTVTAQNSEEMAETHELPTEIVVQQVRMILEDMEPAAIKIGMIGKADNYRLLADLFGERKGRHLVVDPVITCYRGCPWVLDDRSIGFMKEAVLPSTEVFTPSIPDAEVMLKERIDSLEAMEEAALRLWELGPEWVVLKGGHLEGPPVDILFDGQEILRLYGERVETDNDNGSGCQFSAAVACFLALEESPPNAVRRGKAFMERALTNTVRPGKGKGTADPMASVVAAAPHRK